MEHIDIEQIITKKLNGVALNCLENSIYRLNVRPDGTRYSSDKKTRDAQYDADNAAEIAARRQAARSSRK